MRSMRVTGLVLLPVLALTACGGSSEDGSPAGDPIVVGSDDGSPSQTPTGEGSTGASAAPTGSEQSDGSTGASTETTRTPADADLREATFAVDVARALQISAEQTGAEDVVHAIELDYSDSARAWVWSIDTLAEGTEHEVEIDADTGEVLDHEQDSSDDREHAVDPTDPMTPEEAMAKAQGKVDGPVSGWKLAWDDGMTAYQFDIGSGSEETEVTVTVDTGEVTVDED